MNDAEPQANAPVPQPDPTAMLLISGAGLSSWIWESFAGQFPAGASINVASRPAQADAPLAEYVEAAIQAAPAEQFTIVGHSLGAIIGLATAAAIPDRVAGLVAIAGVVPEPPGSFITAMPIPNRWILSAAMRFVGTRPPEKAIRKTLTAGLEASVADRIVKEFVPESFQVFRSRIERTDVPARRGYVFTSNDAELPPKLQQRCSQALAPAWSTTIATGHMPMLEDPAGLANVVTDFIDGS